MTNLQSRNQLMEVPASMEVPTSMEDPAPMEVPAHVENDRQVLHVSNSDSKYLLNHVYGQTSEETRERAITLGYHCYPERIKPRGPYVLQIIFLKRLFTKIILFQHFIEFRAR